MKNRNVFIVLFLLIMLVAVISSCYYDIEDQLYPNNGNCDTTALVNYSSTVKAILSNNNCIGCHSGAGASGGINLDSYTGVDAVAQNGKLYGSISRLPGYSAMPQSGNKMSNCDIQKLKKWIDSGSPNN
jgi:mono/diheme cytochrome c family protein